MPALMLWVSSYLCFVLCCTDYEAFLSCERINPCEAAGYIAISLGTSDPMNAQYYLAVGGASANSFALVLAANNTPAINLTTDDVRLQLLYCCLVIQTIC